ncbi:glycosyltransferase [Pelomonas sp. KK5]|uniref:glycosyltransferase n=1 Tax=Pelomonas sp. KK5 TaxID=1855730 RepID=UPI0018E91F01|nr:glycosyltransferase [Pelomonas sp. KK5]
MNLPHSAIGSRPKRLGLLAYGFIGWGGGLDFLRGIATGLRHADPELELHVLVPMRGPLATARSLRDAVRGLLGRPTGAAHQPHLEHLERALADTDAILHKIDLGPRAAARAASRLQLDALIPAFVPQASGAPPWVGYIYDFQHKRLPQFFSSEECARRDIDFGRMLDSAEAVIVNARDVEHDIERYFPHRRARIFALPFSPAPGHDAFAVQPDDACRRHGIVGPYFIVCNQFWKHKDHGTAFKALAVLAKRHPELSLVCTGATSDYRFPGYFDELMKQAAHDGIDGRIHALGLIPKPDQLALIRGAVALIQPTLFEGGPGGGAVYDAIALGQRAIASDIPVNTEIDDSLVSFFRTGNADSLADAMLAAWADHAARECPPPPEELIARGVERRRACGDVLLQAVAHAMAVGASPSQARSASPRQRIPQS